MRKRITQRLDTYAKACLLTVVALAPLAFNRSAAGIFGTTKLAVIWILGVGAMAAWASWSAEQRAWVPRFNLLGAAGLFLAAQTLATLFSEQRLVSIIGGYQRYGGLVSFFLYAAIFVVIAGLYWNRPQDLRQVSIAWGGAATLMAAYVLIQAVGLDWNPWTGGSSFFPIGTLGNSNFAGAFLGISSPAVAYLALTAKKVSWRWALTGALGLILLALWYTGTRGGMVAAFAGLVIVAIAYRRLAPLPARVAVAAAAVLVIGLGALALRPTSNAGTRSLSNTFLRTESFIDRTDYWKSALRIFKDNPIIGTGPETYSANYPRYRYPAEAYRNGTNVTDKPHQIFLEYAANSGVLGLGSYLALVCLALAYGWRRLDALVEPQRLLLASFIGALTGYLAQGFFSIDVPPLALTGWVAIGCIAAFADPALVKGRRRESEKRAAAEAAAEILPTGSSRSSRTPPAPPRWPVHAAIAVAAGLLIVPALRLVLADVKARSGQVEKDGRRSLAFYQQAARLNPYESEYRWKSGLAAERAERQAPDAQKSGLLGVARHQYDEAIRLRPNRLAYLESKAKLETYWALNVDRRHFDDADKAWQKAVKLDRYDQVLHREYGEMLRAWARSGELNQTILNRAAVELRASLEPETDDPEAWINLAQQYRTLGQDESVATALGRALHKKVSAAEASQILVLIP
ncbi:MAG: O-antigen ligase family protein [Actinomycetota bacterium]